MLLAKLPVLKRMKCRSTPGWRLLPTSSVRCWADAISNIFQKTRFVSGICGTAIVRGCEENNRATCCPKHFALNEQETYRRGKTIHSIDAVNSIVEERAAREIYLRPFEMIVRGSHVRTFMSSFNRINGTFAGGSYDLCTRLLRGEWGFEGVVVTDWGDMDVVVDGGDAVHAGNDIVMPGGPPVIAQIQKH